MNRLRQILFRLQPFFRRRKIEADLSEEMRVHLEMATDANIAAGMSPEEAGDAALRASGGVDQVKEAWRDERGISWIEDCLRDLRFAVRGLRKNPGFTIAVVATLAIGIGATTAIVNIGRQQLFPVIPYPEPERVVIVNNVETVVPQLQVPYPFFAFPCRFAALREAVTSFAGLGAERQDSLNLVVNGDPVAAEVGWVNADFFAVLGAKSQHGRLFLPDEYQGTNGDVAVLSWQIWEDRFAADPGIVGRDILLGGKSRRVVGVLSKSFAPPPMFVIGEIYLPEEPSPTAVPWPFRWMQVVGRLKSGVTREQAEAETVVITGRDPALKTADALEKAKPRLVPLTTYWQNGASNLFWLFLAAVGFLYVIACSNAASLMLARTIARRRELGVRLAMGGSRWQIARLLLAESLLLSLTGGGLGLLIAGWSCSAWKVFFSGDSPIDRVTLVAALVTSVLTCGLVVLVPIGRIRRTGLHEVMQEGSGALGDSRRLSRQRAAFVVVQAALAVVLLAGTGLMAKSFLRLQHVNLGFDPGGKLAITGTLPEGLSQEAYLQLAGRLREILAHMPGVREATFSELVPFTNAGALARIKIDGRPELGEIEFSSNRVSPEYFATLGVPIIAGRGFSGMKSGDAPVAVINETASRRCFGTTSPIGQRLDFEQYGKWEIIGVAGDVRSGDRRAEVGAQMYCPFWQPPVSTGFLTELLCLNGRPGPGFDSMVRRSAFEVDPRIVVNVHRLSDNAAATIQRERNTTVVLQGLSFLALALAALGMFSVMAYAVEQQRREFGVRMALGAAPGDLLRLVLRRGLVLAALGMIIGLGAAWGLTRLLRTFLFETSPHDPATFAVVPLVLLAIAILACWLPARRASKVDPIVVLRAE